MPSITNRTIIPGRYIVEGQPLLINLITAPTIEDVLAVEAHLYAASLDRNDPSLTENRSVPFNVRDYLIRIGVER